ncbi:MAG: hypothetical protein KBA61_11825 [Spirochaetes bacterium]|nr:hypothetical protein [Spirochaetota bacterium]
MNKMMNVCPFSKYLKMRTAVMTVRALVACTMISLFVSCSGMTRRDTSTQLNRVEQEKTEMVKDSRQQIVDADRDFNANRNEYLNGKATAAKEFSQKEKVLQKKIRGSSSQQKIQLKNELEVLRLEKQYADREREREYQAQKRKYDATRRRIAVEQQCRSQVLSAEKNMLGENLRREESDRKKTEAKAAVIRRDAQRQLDKTDRAYNNFKATNEKQRIENQRRINTAEREKRREAALAAEKKRYDETRRLIEQNREKRQMALDEEVRNLRERRRQEESARRAKLDEYRKQVAARQEKEEEIQRRVEERARAEDEKRADDDARSRRKLTENLESAGDCDCEFRCMPGWSAGVDLKATDLTKSSTPVRMGCSREKPAMHIEYRNRSMRATLDTRLCYKRWDDGKKTYTWRRWHSATLRPGESTGEWSCETSEYRLFQKKVGEIPEEKKEINKAAVRVAIKDLRSCEANPDPRTPYCISYSVKTDPDWPGTKIRDIHISLRKKTNGLHYSIYQKSYLISNGLVIQEICNLPVPPPQVNIVTSFGMLPPTYKGSTPPLTKEYECGGDDCSQSEFLRLKREFFEQHGLIEE